MNILIPLHMCLHTHIQILNLVLSGTELLSTQTASKQEVTKAFLTTSCSNDCSQA